jgi:hypothetical protein
MMTLANAMTKSLTAVSGQTGWTPGSGNWGLDTGTVAATAWYHVFLIQRPDTGAVDILLSTSATAPTMPSPYSKKRRIGSIVNVSSAILGFTQVGDQFLWNAARTDLSNAGANTTWQSVTLATPPGVKTLAIVVGQFNASGSNLWIAIAPPDITASTGGATLLSLYANVAGWVTQTLQVRTNTLSQINYQSNVTIANGFYIITQGYIDNRGK